MGLRVWSVTYGYLLSVWAMKRTLKSTFTLMWEEALKQYKSLTSMDLGALATATGAETIEDLQQAIDQNQYALVRDRAKGAEMRQALQPVLGFLHSFAGAFGEAGAFGTLSPSKVIAGSVKAVLDACQEVRDSNDLVFESFKDLSAFLKRMKIHTGSQEDLVPELKLACTELLYQFLIVMGTMYSVVKRGRFNRMVNYLAKSPDCIAIQVREFERMCGNLDGMLLSLIFEATRPTSSQRLTSRRDSVLAEAGSLNSASQPAQYLQPRHWHRVFRGSCVTPAIAISLVVLAAGLTFPAAQLYHRSFTSNHQCE
ncbi:hypothetical protein DL96DRAFT_893893 [Flagelloscypha sp. PMI_526]|nr:hypothetical protein DL96DRAFT_893893 [Flagelloscypha sp. PMI_526]